MRKTKSFTDEEVVRLVRTQDQELYEEIVRRYQEKLIRYATYLVKDEDEALDVVQQAFLKAFVNLQGFDLKKKFSSWIYRIVHNEAINYLKKNKREVSLDKNDWLKEIIGSKENVEKDYDKKEMGKMLRQCLKELPLSYRSVLTLFFLEEKSYDEISDVLRIPLGTVGTRINRGKKVIKAIFQKKGGEVYVKNQN